MSPPHRTYGDGASELTNKTHDSNLPEVDLTTLKIINCPVHTCSQA